MLKITRTTMNYFAVLWMAVLLLFAGGQLYAQSTAPNALPPGVGKDLLTAACTQCHGLRPILISRYGAAGWKNIVENKMVMLGAQLLPEESGTLIQYLTKNFGPGSLPAQTGVSDKAKEASLPAGTGKELVESRCALCHDLDRVTSTKRSQEEWGLTVKDMVEWGIAATPEEIQTMSSYLALHFGEKAK